VSPLAVDFFELNSESSCGKRLGRAVHAHRDRATTSCSPRGRQGALDVHSHGPLAQNVLLSAAMILRQ
jgi:hypothetical protein